MVEAGVASAVAGALRNADSLCHLVRGAADSLPLSSLLLVQSVRAAVRRQGAVGRDPGRELATLLEAVRLAPPDLGLQLSADGLRVRLAEAPIRAVAGATWPESLRAVLIRADSAAPVSQVVLQLRDADCILSQLAAALHAPEAAPSQAVGPRHKAGRPRDEPRLYVAAPTSNGAPRNERASWLAGASLFGDALLAHVALPPRRWPGSTGAARTELQCFDVSVAQYEQLCDAALPSGMFKKHGGSMPRAPGDTADEAPLAKSLLSELCAHFGDTTAPDWAPVYDVEELRASADDDAHESDDDLFVSAAGASSDASAERWWSQALAETVQLLRTAPRKQRMPRLAGFRATVRALSLPPRSAVALTRAAAEHAAALALLWDAQAAGEAALGRCTTMSAAVSDDAETLPNAVALFSPPLADQRRAFVISLLRAAGATSVLDLGSGSGALLLALACGQHGGGGTALRRAAGIELSPARTAEAQRALERQSALSMEVSLFQGSLLDACAFARPGEYAAITCIEVIEHLPSEADAYRAGAVMLRLAPRLAVVTTPNADCNVALEAAGAGLAHVPQGSVASGRMRDVDHKFEWSAQQFSAWARAAVDASGGAYDVSLLHLGALRTRLQPSGVPRMGASQAAVFVRRVDAPPVLPEP